jgi:hypothetical protein
MRFAPLAALLVAAPLAAQQPAARPVANADPDKNVAGGITVPGWTARFDRATSRPDQVKFAKMGAGLHVTAGPSGIYYDSTQTAAGNYTARATFTQTKAATHPEAYGLFVGGADLQGPAQQYLYFVVRQDGKYTIKHRAGSEVHTLVDWTDSPAVKKVVGAGKATNALAINTTASAVRFSINGTAVKSMPRAQALGVDGVVGLRVNHNLDVHVDGFGVKK